MSLSGLLDIGSSAIFASQKALSITGHNIANVNTPFYSQQNVDLANRTPGVMGIGTGVDVIEVKRLYNTLLTVEYMDQKMNYARANGLAEGFSAAEMLFNEAQGLGLSGVLTEFFNSWQEVANNPEVTANRIDLLHRANDLVDTARRMEIGIVDILNGANKEIGQIVERVNILSADIADLNSKIVQTEAGGLNANDLRDTRDRLMGEMSELVEYNYLETNTGEITIIAGRINIVEGSRNTSLQWNSGTEQLTAGGVDITQWINKGRLGGLLDVNSNVTNNLLTPLRQLVKSVVDEVNAQHQLGFGLDGSTGLDFFYPADTSDLDGIINAFGVAISDTSLIAAAATTTGPGDNGNALAIAELAQTTSIFSDYKTIVSNSASLSRAASDSRIFEKTLLTDIQTRKESVSSVSLDEEAMNIIKFQRAFEAGAKMISVTDELMETILRMI